MPWALVICSSIYSVSEEQELVLESSVHLSSEHYAKTHSAQRRKQASHHPAFHGR